MNEMSKTERSSINATRGESIWFPTNSSIS